MLLCWPLSMRPRHYDRFVLIGLCWLYGRSEFPPPPPPHALVRRPHADRVCRAGSLEIDCGGRTYLELPAHALPQKEREKFTMFIHNTMAYADTSVVMSRLQISLTTECHHISIIFSWEPGQTNHAIPASSHDYQLSNLTLGIRLHLRATCDL